MSRELVTDPLVARRVAAKACLRDNAALGARVQVLEGHRVCVGCLAAADPTLRVLSWGERCPDHGAASAVPSRNGKGAATHLYNSAAELFQELRELYGVSGYLAEKAKAEAKGIARLPETVKSLEQENAELRARVARLEAENAALRGNVVAANNYAAHRANEDAIARRAAAWEAANPRPFSQYEVAEADEMARRGWHP